MRLPTLHVFNRRSIKIDFWVNYQQWIVWIDNIVIYTNTIQVLLQKTFEKHIFFLKSSLLLFNRKLVKKNFVVSFVKIIKELEFVVSLLFKTFNFFYMNIRNFFESYLIALIERKNFFLFSLKLSAKLSCFQYLFTKLLIVSKSIHALFWIYSEIT